MLSRRSDNARLQSDFYRDQFRRMLRWLMMSMMLMILLVLCIIYFILAQPHQDYYANTSEGRIMGMPASGGG